MTTLAFVDSLPALERVREKFPDAQPVTDNPLLAADVERVVEALRVSLGR